MLQQHHHGDFIDAPPPCRAVEWERIDHMPCTIKVLPVVRKEASFHDFEGYEHLVDAARIKGW